VSDTATLSGATSTAGGTITFFVSTSSTCPNAGAIQVGSPVTVSGNGNYPSSSQTFNTPGTYYWYAAYTGDLKNKIATSACEPLTVTAFPPTVPEFPLGQVTFLAMIAVVLPVALFLRRRFTRPS
jgi:hypothetical protein